MRRSSPRFPRIACSFDPIRSTVWPSFAVGGLILAAVTLPIAPINTAWWRVSDAVTGGCFNSEIGWPELVAAVARVRNALPTQDHAHLAILTGDDGETGAIALYGPAYGLPPAISGMNTAWARGYGDQPPQTVIAVGMDPAFLQRHFESCQLGGRVTNPWGIENSAIGDYSGLWVCRNLREPWPEAWARFQYYG